MKSINKKDKVSAKGKARGIASLVAEVRDLVQLARRGAASVIDTVQVMTNFEIGRRIVEQEQKGAKRAEYGKELIKELSVRLGKEFGRGFSVSNLQFMRQFFLEYSDRIHQTASVKLAAKQKHQTVSGELAPFTKDVGRRALGNIPWALSWSHYVLLLSIKDPSERAFYEVEATNEGWSVSELKRQKATALYERLALSRDKAGIKRLAREGQHITKPEDLFKEPYVLEFLGLNEQATYSETELESALISHIEKFLLELGKGFLFEARQRRFTFDEDHYYVDLVFYNRLLRCYVLIDLKIDKLTHQDLGQMQMYVNYYDRKVKLPDENPTVGLLLCKSKKQTIVELTLPRHSNIHAREYELYLPSTRVLKAKLIEWTREAEGMEKA